MQNRYTFITITSVVLFITGCSTKGVNSYKQDKNLQHYTPIKDTKTYAHPTMKPYEIMGIKYYPISTTVGAVYEGKASWYGPDFHGKLTSNGEVYDMMEMTAAHKTLPMNTILRVTNKDNGMSTVVRVNDRGPFVDTRIIDLSKAAAKKIDMIKNGTASISIEVLGFAPKNQASKKRKVKKNISKKDNKKFHLQIGSFANIDGAIKIQEKYDGTDGYKTIIKDIQRDNKRIFKVLLDGFKNRKEIVEYKKREKDYFHNAFIVQGD